MVKGLYKNYRPLTFSKTKFKIISTRKNKIFDFVYEQFEDENLKCSNNIGIPVIPTTQDSYHRIKEHNMASWTKHKK